MVGATDAGRCRTSSPTSVGERRCRDPRSTPTPSPRSSTTSRCATRPGWLAVAAHRARRLLTPLAALRLAGLRWLPGARSCCWRCMRGRARSSRSTPARSCRSRAGAARAARRRSSARWPSHYATDLRERRRLRTAFARFVPAAGRRRGGGPGRRRDLRLGGTRLEGTVAVLRPARLHRAGRAPARPSGVIEMLNRYLTRDERRDPRPRRDRRLLHGRRDHGRVRRAAASRTTTPTARWRPRARCSGPRLARPSTRGSPRPASASASRWAIGICSGPVMSGNVGSRAAPGVRRGRRHDEHRRAPAGDDEGRRGARVLVCGGDAGTHCASRPRISSRPGRWRLPGARGPGARCWTPRLLPDREVPAGDALVAGGVTRGGGDPHRQAAVVA